MLEVRYGYSVLSPFPKHRSLAALSFPSTSKQLYRWSDLCFKILLTGEYELCPLQITQLSVFLALKKKKKKREGKKKMLIAGGVSGGTGKIDETHDIMNNGS